MVDSGGQLGARPLIVMPFLHSYEPGGVERVALRLCGAWAKPGTAHHSAFTPAQAGAHLRKVQEMGPRLRGGDGSELPALDIRLVMGRDDGAMIDESPRGLPIHMIDSGRLSTSGWETIWMMVVLRRMIRAQRPDVLFAAGNTYAIVAVAMKLALGSACPPVVMKVSNDLVRRDLPAPARWFYRRWLSIQGRYIDHFVGLAEPMRAEIIEGMGVAAARVSIVDDPALDATDLAALAAVGEARAAKPPGAARHFVGVGRLAGQKNWPLLIDAFAKAANPDDRLTIVGEGPERARLERRIARAGLTGRVSLPGHCAVPPALAAADVFVLSSDYEGVPAVVIEALASGLPVVATDCSVSMRRLVADFGELVPVGNSAALAAAMRRATGLDAGKRRAAAAAMAAFTVEVAAGRYAALFTAVCTRHTDGRSALLERAAIPSA